MTHLCNSLAALAAVAATLAAQPLAAAPQPAGVPTYQGVKPAGKPLPKSVPAYRLQPSTPKLIRRGMNAPRPGVAVPGPCREPRPQPATGSRGKEPAARLNARQNAARG